MNRSTKTMARLRWMVLLLASAILLPLTARAAEPVRPELSPEAKELLAYLESIQGKKVLTGISGSQDAKTWAVLHLTGREPAISGGDMEGFHPKTSDLYRQIVQGTVNNAKRWWLDKGGIVAFQYHWAKPGHPTKGSAWVAGGRGTGSVDLAKAITPGTDEYKAVMKDLAMTADYLQPLADARVPVLWRPFHEIDGSWFWWTDTRNPENTAALWRVMFDYFVKERKLTNLIWVFNAAHISHGLKKKDATLDEEVAYRRRFYPGDEYVHIASIDTYGNAKLGWGAPWEDARGRAFELMRRVAPGKPLAIAEDSALCNPDLLQKDGSAWIYSSAWWVGGKSNPVEWMRKTFNHEHLLTLDELPPMGSHNIAPCVRIESPAEGTQVEAPGIEITGQASDRNGNLQSVTLYALSGPWQNWFLRNDTELLKAVSGAARLGEAKLLPDGRWSFTWAGAAAGFHTIVAQARDAEGAIACSNAVRLSVQIANLARGRAVTASSTSAHGGAPEAAVDGDPNSMWWADNTKPDPQWLAVDLGQERTIGAVSIAWWKAFASAYTVEVSADGQQWREVAAVKQKRTYHGDMDVHRFEPVKARHVRLHCTARAVTWQSYAVFELGVYESIPK